MPNIVLTSGTSWTVPADWNNSNNTIYCLGAGGQGGHQSGAWNGGGAGGAFAQRSNVALTPGSPVPIQIGVPGGTTGAGTAPTGNTWFRDGATCVATGGVTATSPTGAAGTSANCVGDATYPGGAGGNGTTNHTGGGGGAAGPNGAGLNGSSDTSGAGDNGTGGAAKPGAPGGANGNPGTEWPGSTAGSGSGAGGTTSNANNTSVAGAYGGAGSGAAGTNALGTPGGGLIVVSYTPIVPAILAQALGGDPLPRVAFVPPALRQALAEWVSAATLPTPALTPATQFSAGDDSLPRRAIEASRLLARMSAVESQAVRGLILPPPSPPPILQGRATIPIYMFVPLEELVLHCNDLINSINFNLYGLGLDPHNLLSGFQQLSPDELIDSLNLIIEGTNKRLNQIGLPVAQNIQYFVGVEPSETTLAFNTLINELNQVFLAIFGA